MVLQSMYVNVFLSLQRSMPRLFSCLEKFVQQYKSINMTHFDLKLVKGGVRIHCDDILTLKQILVKILIYFAQISFFGQKL